jgi:hypothetical protein
VFRERGFGELKIIFFLALNYPFGRQIGSEPIVLKKYSMRQQRQKLWL